jgi:hypothetical protein
MELDAAKLMRGRGIDSLGIAFFGVRDAAGNETVPGAGVGAVSHDLYGGDIRLRRNGLELGGELVRALTADSSALAGRASARWTLPGDRLLLEGEWLTVGDGFSSTANPRLSSGLEELRLGAEVRVAEGSRIRVRHERQSFRQYDVERATTTLQAEQTVAGRKVTAEGGLASDVAGTAGTTTSATGKAVLAVTPEMDVWVEGSRVLDFDTASTAVRPDQLAFGASYRVLPGTRVEASHRWVRMQGDSATYALTSMGVRTEQVLGGQLWGSLEHADAASAGNSAVLGWNQRLSLSGGWQFTSLFERRIGLDRAPLVDPVRALPFLQPERDRWSAGLGVEWLPTDGRPRLGARGEMHDGRERSGWRVDVTGDAPLGRSLALLTRHDWSRDEWSDTRGDQNSRRERSILGLAYRPVFSDAFNALAKVEWRRTMNPLAGGGVLASARDESRMIGAADAVWAPRAATELSMRYAMRWTEARDTALGPEALRSFAHYAGMRLDQGMGGALSSERFPLSARLDGRMLLEGVSGQARWSLAPSLVMGLGPTLELEGGYRFGDLRDPDFANNGGKGFFATLGIRFTESVFSDAAAFWRERITR